MQKVINDIDLGSLIISQTENNLMLLRTKSFKFWQWVAYISMVVIHLLFVAFFIKVNLAQIKANIEEGDGEKIGIMLILCIVVILAIPYMLWNIRRTTVDHKISVVASTLYVDAEPFCDLDELIKVKTIRNIGWKGIGVSYSAAIVAEGRQRIVAYYLKESQIAIVVESMKQFLRNGDV